MMKNLRNIFRFKHFQVGVMAIATLLMVHSSVVYADPIPPPVDDQDTWSPEDLNASNNYYAWYDPTVKKCVFGASGSQTVATGPAAELLTKAGLDKQWVNVIIKYASANGADPIAMARVDVARKVVDDKLARGESVYGANTGVGAMKDVEWSPEDLETFNLGLVRAHHFGTGAPFPSSVVRSAADCWRHCSCALTTRSLRIALSPTSGARTHLPPR